MKTANEIKRLCPGTLLSLILLLLSVTPLHSQAGDRLAFQPAEGKIPITVVLAEGDGPPLIFRRASEPRNVIVVNGSALPPQLSAAVFSLLVTEARDPGGRERSDHVALRVTVPRSVPAYEHAAEAISRLQAARARRVGTFGGELRAIDVWVAPRRGHHQ